MKPTLSILTPAIWSRLESANMLRSWIASLPGADRIEHLVLFDDCKRSVGAKRQALLDAARGTYVAYVDDDDTVSEDYITRILKAATLNSDVITFKQEAVINGKSGFIEFSGTVDNDPPWQEGATVKRAPWHVCAWKRALVKSCIFPDIMDGEDLAWSVQARRNILSAAHIDAVLHRYLFNSATTAASGKTFPA